MAKAARSGEASDITEWLQRDIRDNPSESDGDWQERFISWIDKETGAPPTPPRRFHEVVPVREMDDDAFGNHLELRHPMCATTSRLAHTREHREFQDQLFHVHVEEEC